MCCFQLLNIPPEYRSKLSTIQLVTCSKSRDVKQFGLQHLLSDFMCLKTLYAGMVLTVNGCKRLVHGLLVCLLGDTLPAQKLGGFKEGVGTAHRPCRTCEVTNDKIAESSTGADFEICDATEHRERIALLSELSSKTRSFWSR